VGLEALGRPDWRGGLLGVHGPPAAELKDWFCVLSILPALSEPLVSSGNVDLSGGLSFLATGSGAYGRQP
jgi:hypothetical protein